MNAFSATGGLACWTNVKGNRPGSARGALAVVKQHPLMVLFVASPAIIALGLVWAFVSHTLAVVLLLALVVGGGVAVLRKR